MGDVSPPPDSVSQSGNKRHGPSRSPLGLGSTTAAAAVQEHEIDCPSSDADAAAASQEPLKTVFAMPPPPPPSVQDKARSSSVIFSPSSNAMALATMASSDPKKKADKAAAGGDGATLVWRDLTVTTGGGGGGKRRQESAPTKVLKSSTGFARPGSMLSIMGPACSGKNTLLKALAGQLPSSAKLYGEILLNGFRQPLAHGTYAYVRPEEELIESLTVCELLYYSALLQLPSGLPLSKKLSRVDACISEMDLEELVSIRVGCKSHNKTGGGGLSRFERKRLSLAMHMLSCPYLLFLEEPTYGLDSLEGVLVIATLRKLASARRCTVLMTMQQATSHAWPLLDQLCLLSIGTTVYFGPSKGALEQFANAGFPCPRLQNPTDHFLGLIDTSLDHGNSAFRFGQDEESGDQMWSQIDAPAVLRTLEATFQASSEAGLMQSLVVQLLENEGPVLESAGHAGLLMCISVLTWRSCVSMGREFGYYWLRLLLSVVLALCIGTMYYNLGHSVDSIRERAAAVFVTIAFLGLLSIVGFPSMVKEVKIVYQEIAHGRTGFISMFVFANTLASVPFLLVLALICALISYFLIGLHPMFILFVYFVINVFMCFAIMDGLMMLIATLLPKVFEGMVATLSIHILMLLVAGYFRLADDLPTPVWTYPASYLSFYTYSIQGLLQNEYAGVTFASAMPKAPPVSPEVTLQNTFQAPDAQLGKWVNVLVLAGMAIGYRVLVSLSFLLFQAMALYKHRSLRRIQDE